MSSSNTNYKQGERRWRESAHHGYERDERKYNEGNDRFSGRRELSRERSGYRDERRDERKGFTHDGDYDNGRRNHIRDRRDHSRERERREREHYDDRNRHDLDRKRRRSASPRRERPSSSRPRSRSRSKPRSPPPEDNSKPNFGASGLLAAETNTVRKSDGSSTLLKYNEPPEARKPAQGWRLYVFKGSEQVGLLHISQQSAYLIGRDHAVVDIVLDHPSCSKQHAVIQYRQITEKDEYGGRKVVIKPFVIDLESTNGTSVNGETIPTTRFYELKPSDVLTFGQSTREYVLLHDEAS